MPDLDLHVEVNANHICDLASLKPTFDIVIVCVKSYDTKWAVQLIEPFLADDGVLVGIQNSMNDDAHGEIVGASGRSAVRSSCRPTSTTRASSPATRPRAEPG